MKNAHDEHRESIERFVRSENVARFGRMLAAEHNESERRILSELIAEERGKQMNAKDFS